MNRKQYNRALDIAYKAGLVVIRAYTDPETFDPVRFAVLYDTVAAQRPGSLESGDQLLAEMDHYFKSRMSGQGIVDFRDTSEEYEDRNVAILRDLFE